MKLQNKIISKYLLSSGNDFINTEKKDLALNQKQTKKIIPAEQKSNKRDLLRKKLKIVSGTKLEAAPSNLKPPFRGISIKQRSKTLVPKKILLK